MALIACVGLDPFLVALVRRLSPDHDVEPIDADADVIARRSPRAVVMAADHPAAASLVQTRLGERTILVVEPGRTAAPWDHPGPVLTRPVAHEDLVVALNQVLPWSRREWLARLAGRLPDAASSAGAFAAARLAAVAAAAALEMGRFETPVPWVALVLATTLVVVRLFVRQLGPALVAVDILVTAMVIVTSGGPRSSFLLLAAVAAAEVGFAFRVSEAAAIVGAALVLGTSIQVPEVREGDLALADLATWASLLPLATVVGAMARRIELSRQTTSRDLLDQLRRTLESLLRQAQGAVAALEATSVADEVLASARDDLGAVAGIILSGDPPVRTVLGTFGLERSPPPRMITDITASDRQIPAVIADGLPPGQVLTAPLRVDHVDLGLLVLVLPPDARERHVEPIVDTLADEAGLALQNVRLFDRIREMSVDRERQRLARDLHDGVVQSLVHLGFELDLLRHSATEEVAKELTRLREVVSGTVDEVRTTVNDLRSVRLSAGLGAALSSLARELAVQDGPQIDVLTGPVDLSPEAELQLFRLCQEALSNAVQHAQARTITVQLGQRNDRVRLEVADDGLGMVETAVPEAGRGVGLRAMAERARLLGGDLRVQTSWEGGTSVVVEVSALAKE